MQQWNLCLKQQYNIMYEVSIETLKLECQMTFQCRPIIICNVHILQLLNTRDRHIQLHGFLECYMRTLLKDACKRQPTVTQKVRRYHGLVFTNIFQHEPPQPLRTLQHENFIEESCMHPKHSIRWTEACGQHCCVHFWLMTPPPRPKDTLASCIENYRYNALHLYNRSLSGINIHSPSQTEQIYI